MLSEYGITEAKRPVEINRALRRAGLLNVYTQAGMEYLDPWTSRAFAVADHQIAHVYTSDVAAAREALTGLEGIAELLEGSALADAGLAHERSGELVALAERDAWFTYHYWLDNEHAPDFGRQVEIHRKPGYDPAELFFDPDDERGAKLRGGLALARKKAGMRYVLSWWGWMRRSTSAARTGCCPTPTRTRRCSCARRLRSRGPGSRRRKCETCCWIWLVFPPAPARARRTRSRSPDRVSKRSPFAQAGFPPAPGRDRRTACIEGDGARSRSPIPRPDPRANDHDRSRGGAQVRGWGT